VYLALVHLGNAAVGEISKISKVRREEVYRILPKLEKLGLIEKTLSTPVNLKATPVENALSILIKNEEETARAHIIDLTKRKDAFLENFHPVVKDAKSIDGDQFSLTSEKIVSLGKINSLIELAQNSIEYVASREKLLQFIKYFQEPLIDALNRGVQLRIISNPPKDEDEIRRAISQAFENKAVSVRYLETVPNHFLITDNKEVLMATFLSGYLADNPVLWSKNVPQVMVYKKLFSDLWESSVEQVALNMDSEVDRLKRFIRQTKPSQHFMFLYESNESKYAVSFNFLRYGLESGEACVYACSESSVEEVEAAAKIFGLDIDRYGKSGALRIVDYTDLYLLDGQFSVDAVFGLWQRYCTEASSKGFKGLRVVSEMSCFFKHNLTSELIEYENSLHKRSGLPMISLYAYRANQLVSSGSTKIYAELVKLHGNVLFSWIDKKLRRIAIS
jgi:sugar-specific transcriptional regulator TrmB